MADHSHCCHQDHEAELAQHHKGDAVCVDHISFRYVPGPPVVDQVTMHIPQGVRLGIIGPNGGGKSTLLKLILGLLKPNSGKISVFGKKPGKACSDCLVGYVPQRHDFEIRFPLSVTQVVHQGLLGRTGMLKPFSAADRADADRAMEEVGITRLASQPVGDLSGGQQQLVFFARALASRPKLLVLDEPLVGVDEGGQAQFALLMDTLHKAYDLTVFIVSHDLRAIVAGCDQVACLNRRLHFHAAPSGLTREVLAEVFSHTVGDLSLEGERP